MSAGVERRREDLRRLEALCAVSSGRLEIHAKKGDPPSELTVNLRCRTAASAEYPANAADGARAWIQFPARYPFQEPLVEIKSSIFHPNVYVSGRICFGTKWLPAEGLDLLIKRVIQVVTFDPVVLNLASPANRAAAEWYRTAVARFPSSFPTDALPLSFSTKTKAKPQWRDLPADSPPAESRVIRCAECQQQLRVGRPGGQARCPRCGHTFQVR